MLLCYNFLHAVSMNVLHRALSPNLVVLLLKISSNFLILFSCGLPVGLNNHLSVPTGPQEMRKEEKEKGRARMFERIKERERRKREAFWEGGTGHGSLQGCKSLASQFISQELERAHLQPPKESYVWARVASEGHFSTPDDESVRELSRLRGTRKLEIPKSSLSSVL